TRVRPSNLISIFSRTVLPNRSAKTPYFSATSLIHATLARSQEMTILLASSPNNKNSEASSPGLKFTEHPTPFGKEHQAKATTTPPSEQSCAESTNPAPINSTIAFCSAASFSSSSAGGNPHSWPTTSLAYSDEPNSVSASVASPGSEPRNRTTARPASRKCGNVAFAESSRIPTTPSTGVG